MALFLQSYFLILIIGGITKEKRPVPFQIVDLCTRYITCYFIQLYFLIQAFNDVKSLSVEQISRLATINSAKPVKKAVTEASIEESTELLLIQRLHQDFKFLIYGANSVDNSLMQLVFIFWKLSIWLIFNFFRLYRRLWPFWCF